MWTYTESEVSIGRCQCHLPTLLQGKTGRHSASVLTGRRCLARDSVPIKLMGNSMRGCIIKLRIQSSWRLGSIGMMNCYMKKGLLMMMHCIMKVYLLLRQIGSKILIYWPKELIYKKGLLLIKIWLKKMKLSMKKHFNCLKIKWINYLKMPKIRIYNRNMLLNNKKKSGNIFTGKI